MSAKIKTLVTSLHKFNNNNLFGQLRTKRTMHHLRRHTVQGGARLEHWHQPLCTSVYSVVGRRWHWQHSSVAVYHELDYYRSALLGLQELDYGSKALQFISSSYVY